MAGSVEGMGAHEQSKGSGGRFMWARWTLVVVLWAGALVIAACIPIIGFTWFFDGIGRMGDASALADRGRHVVGTVQDTRAESGGPGTGVDTYIRVRFTASDRTQHTVWVDGDKDVGDPARVLYDPRHPDNAISGSVTKERVDAVTRIIGGAVLSFGLLIGYAGFAWNRIIRRKTD